MAGTTLRLEKIAETADRLSARIYERFPDSGLYQVSVDLVEMGATARDSLPDIHRPIYWVRIAVAILIAIIVTIVISLLVAGSQQLDQVGRASVVEIVTILESGTNEIFLIGLAILFLVTVETRIRRARSLQFIHELRSLAHVIDMHQLTKDPGYYRSSAKATESSPMRKLTLPEMVRYLDYCSELLSMTSKVAALYAQEMNDRVVLAAVSDVETLVAGLTQKIWQKLDIAETIK